MFFPIGPLDQVFCSGGRLKKNLRLFFHNIIAAKSQTKSVDVPNKTEKPAPTKKRKKKVQRKDNLCVDNEDETSVDHKKFEDSNGILFIQNYYGHISHNDCQPCVLRRTKQSFAFE